MTTFTVIVFLILQHFCSSVPCTTMSRNDQCKELVLLTVIHRHGDRTRDATTYPNDPYINEQFYPYGLGQLTRMTEKPFYQTGQLRMYNVGTQLLQRYRCFLGDMYFPDLIEARSTDLNRTKASLLLSTAGLFRPKGPLVWSLLDWLPVPYNYQKSANDFLLGYSFFICPKYVQLYSEYLNGDGRELYSSDLPFYKYVSENSGVNSTSPLVLYMLYFSLKPEEEWGLKIPTWAKPYLDTEFRKAAITHYKLQTGTTELKKLSAGFFIKNLLENSLQKINNTLTPQKRKLFLYSGHEYNIATILSALGVYYDIIPNYGSHIIIELRRINGVYGFKFLLQNYDANGKMQTLTIPGCSSFCQIDRFRELVQDIIPEDESDCNV